MLYLSTDHAGYPLMQEVIKFLQDRKIKFEYVGAPSLIPTDSYAIYTKHASDLVASDDANMGIFMCGTGIGTTIVANRRRGIRAALCQSTEFARLARFHNNANVLVLPGRFMNIQQAKEIIQTFLNTPFEGGRHIARIALIDQDTK